MSRLFSHLSCQGEHKSLGGYQAGGLVNILADPVLMDNKVFEDSPCQGKGSAGIKRGIGYGYPFKPNGPVITLMLIEQGLKTD